MTEHPLGFDGRIQPALDAKANQTGGAATITGGGTISLAGYTLTVPATGAVALQEYLNTGRIFSGTLPFLATVSARFCAAEEITAHAHYGFLDNSSIDYANVAVQGHASFNSNVTITGTKDSDHHHAFQDTPHFSGSGTLNRLVSFYSIPYVIGPGTITDVVGMRLSNPIGAGAITNLYGVYIPNLNRGSNNYAIYTAEYTKSYFAGNVLFDTRIGVNTGGVLPIAEAEIIGASQIVGAEGHLTIRSNDSMAIDKGGYLTFGGAYTGTSRTVFAGIAGRKENSTNANINGYLAFDTNYYLTGPVERARITSFGNFVIGATDASARLHVQGAAAGITSIFRANATTPGNILEAQNSGGTIYHLLSLTGAVFNEAGIATTDFRVESDTEANMLFLDANADTDGALYLGGSTNGVKINKGGELTLLGTATVWDDVVVNLSNIKAPASDPPTWRAYKGCELPAFRAGGTNAMYFTAQIPHSWKEGSTIGFHIHVAYPDNGAGNSRWTFTYAWASVGSNFPAAATSETLNFASPTTADRHALHTFTDIVGTGQTISSVLLCSISRIGENAADTYGSDIYAISADFHVEKDTMGSKTATAK